MKALCAASIFMLALSPAPSEANGRGERMLQAFYEWTWRHQIRDATFAAMDGSNLAADGSVGSRKSTKRIPLFLLSRPIMQVCIAKLERDGPLPGSTLGELIPNYLAANPPADDEARQITVRSLMGHTSGIFPSANSWKEMDKSRTNLDEQLAEGLAVELIPAEYRGYRTISTFNTVALGKVVEAVTTLPFEKHCAKSVFGSIGVTDVGLGKNRLPMNAWAGWNVSTIGFAKFLDYFRAGSTISQGLNFRSHVYGGGGFAMGEIDGSYADPKVIRLASEGIRTDDRDSTYLVAFEQWRDEVSYVVSFYHKPPTNEIWQDLSRSLLGAAYPEFLPPHSNSGSVTGRKARVSVGSR